MTTQRLKKHTDCCLFNSPHTLFLSFFFILPHRRHDEPQEVDAWLCDSNDRIISDSRFSFLFFVSFFSIKIRKNFSESFKSSHSKRDRVRTYSGEREREKVDSNSMKGREETSKMREK